MDKNNYTRRSTSFLTTCKNDPENPENLICKEEKRFINSKGEEELEINEYTKTPEDQRNDFQDPFRAFFGGGGGFPSDQTADFFRNRSMINQYDQDFDDMDRAFSMFMPLLGNFFGNSEAYQQNRGPAPAGRPRFERREPRPSPKFKKKQEQSEDNDQFYMNKVYNDNEIYDL